ncbi:MAG TPA: DUF1570 domain-containing protein, partial [Pirellulaceae bacterium]
MSLVALAVGLGIASESAQSETLEQARGAYRIRLAELAKSLRNKDRESEAKRVEEWGITRFPDRRYLFCPHVPSNHVRSRDPDLSSQPDEFLTLRREHAQHLWELAQHLLKDGDWVSAYELAHEVAREDPHHAPAGRVIGMKPIRTSANLRARRIGRRHPQWGWKGGTYWQLDSPHFMILSHAQPEALPRIARELEMLRAAWEQLFVDFSHSRSEVERAFDGYTLPRPRIRHRVVFFRDQAEYQDALRSREPHVDLTLGMYRSPDRCSYFFHSESDLRATWQHEATHQLFFEHGPGVQAIGEGANFWIVEGIAVYMESLQRFPGYVTLGGIDAPRLQHARYRTLNMGTAITFADAARFGRSEVQNHSDIRALYSHFAGMTHFLMDFDHGRYRDLVATYLRSIYDGRDTVDTWGEVAGASLTRLDSEYQRSFLPIDDTALPCLAASRRLPKLVLGHCPVTSAGIGGLAQRPIQTLEWLDLTACPIDDAAVIWLRKALRLEQLSLEDTLISDATLSALS